MDAPGEIIGTLGARLRRAGRSLRRDPAFTGPAVFVLALALASAATAFAAYESVVRRPLGFAEPDRLVSVWDENPAREWYQEYVAPANLFDWREQVAAFADVAAYGDFSYERTLTGSGEARVVRAGPVSGNLFRLLGVAPTLGRDFRMEETWSDAEPVVLLSHAFWVRELGGRPEVLGTTLTLGGLDHEVVGVMPERYIHLAPGQEVWIPFRWSAEQRESAFFRRAHLVRAVARLADDVAIESARAELGAVAAGLAEAYPATNGGLGAGITPLQEYLVGDRGGAAVAVLLGALGLLASGLGTVAYLIVVRSTRRAPDIGVRKALGARWTDLAGDLLAEGAWLATTSAALGLLASVLGMRLLSATAPPGIIGSAGLGVRPALLLSLALTTAGAACVFSLLPALLVTRIAPSGLTRVARGRAGGGSGFRLARGFVIGQVALSVTLMAGAGLLARSFLALRSVDPGFDSEGVLTFSVPFADRGDEAAAYRVRVAEALAERIRDVEGVSAAGFVRQLPIRGNGWTSLYSVEGADRGGRDLEIVHREADPGYFAALRVPLLRGRMLEAEDEGRGVLVNETFARLEFGDGNPLGRRVAFAEDPSEGTRWWTIVGVVGDERQNGLAAAVRPEVFTDVRFDTPGTFQFVVRSTHAPATLVPFLRSALRELDAGLPVDGIETLDAVLASSLGRERFLLLLATLFGVLATLLAVAGVLGVTSQIATQWRTELAVRLAVGATPARLLGIVAVRGLLVVTTGLAFGVLGALLCGRLLESFLHGTSPVDPVALGSVGVVISIAGLLATLPPALSAMRTDPARSLAG